MTRTPTPTFSRRQTLKLAGIGLGFGALAGRASADEGRYIVGTSTRAATTEARKRASAVAHVFDFGEIGQAVAGRFPAAALSGLSNRPDVRYIEADGLVHAVAGTGDIDATDGEVPWGVDRVDAEKVHSAATGSGAHVAIVDSGIDADHPEFSGILGEGVDFTVTSGEFSTAESDWDDDNGHGTHCAGTAVALADGTGTGVVGVATAATLHAVKVLNAEGNGYYSDVTAGIAYVADQGWDVASMSFSGPLADVMRDACDYAYGKGVLLVAAAGNDASNVNNYAPAAYDSVVAVSATTKSDSRIWWSNYGRKIELAAPGVNIYSTYVGGGYATLSGTSMACPHVAGAGGLLMSLGYSNTAARTRLQSTAEDLGRKKRDSDYGYGLLDVQAAVGDGGDGGGGSDDTTAPSTPTNLAATATTDTTVDLSWDAATDDTGVDHYVVYRNGTAYSEPTTTSEQVTGLAAETTYSFTVTAVDAADNESDPSEALSVTTDPATETPVGIVKLDATSGSPNNPHADVDVVWEVSGSPDVVTLELYEGTDTSVAPHRSWVVAASGTRSYQEKFASRKTYTVRLVAGSGIDAPTATDTVTA